MNKSLGFLGLGVLALLTLMSFASAAITVNQPQAFTQVNDVVPLTILNSATTPVTVTLPTTATLGSPVKTTATLSYFSDSVATLSIPSISVPAQVGTTPGTVTIYMKVSPDTTNFMLLQGSGSNQNGGTATLTTSDANNTANFFVNFQGNLDLSIDSTKVTSGFGSDQSWYPLDNIEAKIDVTNNGNDTIRSIVVKWEVYDATKQKKVLSGSESSFSLNDGSDKILTIDFQLGSDIIDSLKSGDQYVFYAWATGNDESFTNNPKTYSTTNNLKSGLDNIDVVIDSDFVILSNLQVVNTVSCGSNVQVSGTVWNIGDNDEDGVYIKVFNTALGISQRVNIGTIDSLTSKDITFNLAIPDNAASGQSYDITFQVYNNDNNIFENSNNDQSQVILTLPITGTCSNLPPATVSASLQSSAVSGKELDIAATITNTDSKADAFTLALNSYNSWASLISIDQTSLNLNAGQSQTVLIKLQVNDGVSGDQSLNLVVNQGTQTLSQPISVTVEQATTPNLFSGLGSNAYLWGIAALNIILVLVIIIVAVRVVRKK